MNHPVLSEGLIIIEDKILEMCDHLIYYWDNLFDQTIQIINHGLLEDMIYYSFTYFISHRVIYLKHLPI